MNLEIRKPRPEDMDAYRVALNRGFGRHPRTEKDEIDLFHRRFEIDRALVALDGSTIVGTTDIFSFDLTVPGGAAVPAAGVTMVTVAATHRRRGILRQIMARQLADIRGNGEPLAMLWASESAIYGRFGYGLAIQHERWTIDRRFAEFAHAPASPGNVRWVQEAEARTLFPPVWDEARKTRPGMVARGDAGWQYLFFDPEYRRFGGGAYFFIVYEDHGRVDGYAAYRIRMNFEDGSDAHVINVAEIITTTDASYAALWRLLLNIDLTAKVESWGRAVDEPLWWMLESPRRLQRVPHDAIWVRMIDVPKALAARTYTAQGSLVLDVRDDFCPWVAGRYLLDAGPEGARCTPTTRAPDITLGAAELASIYLGGQRLTPIARAGRAEAHTDRALSKADLMFSSDVAPFCPQGF